MDIFLSYSRADFQIVAAIESALRDAGFAVWRDETRLRGGQRLGEQIDRVLQAAGCVLVCLSPHSVKSDWVRAEMTLAKGKLLPVKIAAFENSVEPVAILGGLFIRDLTEWVQGAGDAQWFKLVDDCREMLGLRAEPGRASAPPPPSPSAKAATTVIICNEGTVGTLVGHVQGDFVIDSGGGKKK